MYVDEVIRVLKIFFNLENIVGGLIFVGLLWIIFFIFIKLEKNNGKRSG